MSEIYDYIPSENASVTSAIHARLFGVHEAREDLRRLESLVKALGHAGVCCAIDEDEQDLCDGLRANGSESEIPAQRRSFAAMRGMVRELAARDQPYGQAEVLMSMPF